MNKRFSAAISLENKRGFVAVIPDIKRVSPKEGDLLRGRDPSESAKQLVRCGAPVLSVVTERERFGGSPELLRRIVQSVETPVLRKDFVTDEAMLEETAELGASAILLICAITDEKNLEKLFQKAVELDIEPLVEVHTAEEMKFAGRLGASLIGVNNRNIVTFEKDNGGPERTVMLASGAPAGSLLISESGIVSPDDVRTAASAGVNAVLVGTALWQAEDLEKAYRSFRIERKDTPCVRS